MKRPPCSRPVIVAIALLLAFLCGCGKFRHKQQQPPRPPATNISARVRNRETPGFVIPGSPMVTGPVGSNSILLADGTLYEGELTRAGVPEGHGHVLDLRGTDQRGIWHRGFIYYVTGTWYAADGTKEVGSWNEAKGAKSGGTIYYTNGWKYVGDWKVIEGDVDVPNGMGLMTSPSGNSFAGEFHNGELDGPGKVLLSDGREQAGYWRHGKYIGPTKDAAP